MRSVSAAHRNDYKLAWVLVAPSVLGFAVFALYPVLRGFYYSFTDFRVLSPAQWVGLDNYRDLLRDAVFWD